ncbi:MAG: 30S ribosomal protein S6 [Elusimicrobiota bacterium]
MMTYETLVLLDPSLGEEDVGKYVGKLGRMAVEHKGKVLKDEKLGRKRLAYPVRKKMEGTYVCLHLALPLEALAGWQKALRLEPNVLRQMTLRQDNGGGS